MLKQCNQCLLMKPLEEFYLISNGSGRTKSECKQCSKEYIVAYYKRNRERCNKQKAEWCANNRQRYNDYMNTWRENNRERVKEISSRSYKKLKEQK